MEKFISQTIDSSLEIYCDISGGPWTIPPDIVAISGRPDLVIVKRKAKTVIIFELTVPYEKMSKQITSTNVNNKNDFNNQL